MPDGPPSGGIAVTPRPSVDEAEFAELVERLREAGVGGANRAIGALAADRDLTNSVWNEVATVNLELAEAGDVHIEAEVSLGGIVADLTAPMAMRIRRGNETVRQLADSQTPVNVNNRGVGSRPQPVRLSGGINNVPAGPSTYAVDVFSSSTHILFLYGTVAVSRRIRAYDGQNPYDRLMDSDPGLTATLGLPEGFVALAVDSTRNQIWTLSRRTPPNYDNVSRRTAVLHCYDFDSGMRIDSKETTLPFTTGLTTSTPPPDAVHAGSLCIYEDHLYVFASGLERIYCYNLDHTGPAVRASGREITGLGSLALESAGAHNSTRTGNYCGIVAARDTIWLSDWDVRDWPNSTTYRLIAWNTRTQARQTISDFTHMETGGAVGSGYRPAVLVTNGNYIWAEHRGDVRVGETDFSLGALAILDDKSLAVEVSESFQIIPDVSYFDGTQRQVDPRTVLKGSYILATEVG